jgi:hypothetical protein
MKIRSLQINRLKINEINVKYGDHAIAMMAQHRQEKGGGQ